MNYGKYLLHPSRNFLSDLWDGLGKAKIFFANFKVSTKILDGCMVV